MDKTKTRTALDALLGALHEQYYQMNTLCIEIMHSNLDLMKQIIELRMELAERRKNADVLKGEAGEGEAAGTA